MTFIDAPNNFFIGRTVDPASMEMTEEAVYYDSRDLTTHGMVLGMTGSGKTGLCITLLEEAILDGIPAIIVDPKGDIGNLLLTFTDLRPEDFEPWIDEAEAIGKGSKVAEYAANRAELWKNGLGGWGIGKERMQKLKDAAQYTIYTPGSDSGVPVSILASLQAPKNGFEGNEEALREQINGLVTAILSLAGISAEPVKDREHVLMANILEHNWRAGQDLSLEDIILQVQEPPFEKLGVFPVDKYMPEDDRFALAMELNNVIAAPSFQSWLEGVPMDIQSLLYEPNGKPRVSIFYTAHLNETERMFVMTLVLESLLGWMRQQKGTSSLRALLYIDEIFGYFPPTRNPPTKEPMMRLLKQARAFGVGVLMATQNPVDLDYKGLANMGTWFIGRLQSEGDRNRVMSGLKEMAEGLEGMSTADVAQMVADIRSRIFLMRNVHDKGVPTLFHSRWAMNYLAGPLTREQIGGMMSGRRGQLLAEATATTQVPQIQSHSAEVAPAEAAARVTDLPYGYSDKQGVLTSKIKQYFMPANSVREESIRIWEDRVGARADNIDDARLAYEPVLLAQASIRYEQRSADLSVVRDYNFRVGEISSSGYVDWKEFEASPADLRQLSDRARGDALYAEVPTFLSDEKRLNALEDELVDVLYTDYRLKVPYSEAFDLFGDPDADEGAFIAQVQQAAREKRDEEVDKETERIAKKLDSIEEKKAKKQRALAKEEAEASQSRNEQIIAVAEGIFNVFSGRRTSTALSKIGSANSRRSKDAADAEETRLEIAEYEQEIAELQAELEENLTSIREKWDRIAEEISEAEIEPYKKNIRLEVFGVGWVPHWYFTADGRGEFVEAYQS